MIVLIRNIDMITIVALSEEFKEINLLYISKGV